MSWREDKLGNVVTLKRGHDLPESARKDGGVPVVSSSGITGFHNVAKAEPPGVVTGRYGTLGEVFYIDQPYWPLNTALYAIDFHGNNPRFVAYFLKLALRGTKSDKAAVPGVNRNDLHERLVLVPDPIGQQRIVAVLQAYDDLIENNRRRIKLLEEAARLIYREWFVHLRFPGYELTEIEGGVPEGWERVPLGGLCYDVREQVDPKSLDPGTNYIGLEHIPRRSITLADWSFSEDVTSIKFRFEESDILFGKIRPYFHKVGFALNRGITSSDAIVIRPTDSSLWSFILMYLSSDEFVAIASKTVREGSKMPRADWKFLSRQKISRPSESIASEFDEVMLPITKQLRSLALQNRRLVQARDLLLPRLMSGEIEV